MAKGIETGDNLIPFCTKLEDNTKEIMEALVKVKKFAGHRELINDMLILYEKEYPQDFVRARKLLAVLREPGN